MKNITFINAGAGSGKTYRLTEVLAKNISDGNCRADQVILTTFGKEAANEFRAKAMETLLKKGMPEQANLLASAAIGTVHSVAFQLIRRYWYAIGTGVEPEVMPVEDVQFFLKQALANIPDPEELEELSKISGSLMFIDEYSSIDDERWQKDLLKIIDLAMNYRISDFSISADRSRKLLEELYHEIVLRITTDEIKEVLNDLKNILPGDNDNATKLERIKKTNELSENISISSVYLHSLIPFLQKLTQGHRSKIPQIEIILEKLADFYCSDLLVKPMKKYQEILFGLAQKSLDEFRIYKDSQNLIDYCDMEIKLLELLKIEEVRENIREQYKQVYVDEFQDSSPIQVEIFTKLSEIAEKSYWVGDPKQSIYGFRGSDPVLIKAIVNEFEKEDDRNLQTDNLENSWRSRPEIVELNNKIFKPALASQVSDPETIPLSPVRPGNSFDNGTKHYPLQHWHFNYPKMISNVRSCHCLASKLNTFINQKPFVQDKVKSKYDKDGSAVTKEALRQMNPGDVAILRLKNETIPDLVGKIKKLGIEVAASEKGMMKQYEIHLITAIIHFLLDQNDQRAKAIILFLTGAFETTEELLNNRLLHIYNPSAPPNPLLNGEEMDDQEKLEAIARWHNYIGDWETNHEILTKITVLRNKAVLYDIPSLLEKIIYEFQVIDIVKTWQNSEQRISNLQSIIKLAQSYQDRCSIMKLGVSLIGFIQYLKDKDCNQSAATGENAVNVLTYHKSKGLEWPVVILTDLTENHLDDQKLIRRDFHGIRIELQGKLDIQDPLNGRQIILLPWPLSKKSAPDKLKNAILGTGQYLEIREEKENEIKRLLYVGMTRARDILITTSNISENLQWITNVTGDSNYKLRLTECPEGCSKSNIFNTGIHIQVEKQQADLCEEEEIISDKNYTYLKKASALSDEPRFRSPSSEIHNEKIKVEIIRDFNFRIDQNMKGAEEELGNCLHNIFYHYTPATDEALFLKKAEGIIMAHKLIGSIPYPEQTLQAIRNLFIFLGETYGAPVHIYRELPLQQEDDGIVYRGEADMVWETAEDLILVDYKSYPGKKEHIIDPQNSKYTGRYAGQLFRYREMLNKSHPQGKQVRDMLVYYAVIGSLIKINVKM